MIAQLNQPVDRPKNVGGHPHPVKSKLGRITIRRAESEQDFERLFRFRYRVYVEEMGRLQRYADCARKRIVEPLDATAVNFIAVEDDAVVGCLRWNRAVDPALSEYGALYQMGRAGDYFPERCSVTTKLMVAPRYRRTSLGIDICVEGFAHAVAQGAICDFMDCNPHLERFFARFGYRPYCGRINHPEYGDVLPMALLFVDHERLHNLRSPFAETARLARPDSRALYYFNNSFFNN